MILTLKRPSLFVFDLDDTLFQEVDFVKSAFNEIASSIDIENAEDLSQRLFQKYLSGSNAFNWLIETYPALNLTLNGLLDQYRNHLPEISLNESVLSLLEVLKTSEAVLILVSDGRSVTQRNKIKALKIESFFKEIYISEEIGHEKSDGYTFKIINEDYPDHDKVMFGDNPLKDFEWPNNLEWISIGLRNSGQNIHSKITDNKWGYPHHYINTFADLVIQYE
jgi:putative hydrolase of the HAD superfamily